MDVMLLIFIVIVCVICGTIGHYIGKEKNREDMGLLLGILFGPIGILIVAVLPPIEKSNEDNTPVCREPPGESFINGTNPLAGLSVIVLMVGLIILAIISATAL